MGGDEDISDRLWALCDSKRTLSQNSKHAMRNHSIVPEFVLLGLSAGPQTQALLFVLFLVIYLLTVMGNLLLLVVVNADSCFHTPMYFF
ncbi:hypothetical protein H8959_014818 [Pygathrix nigripes]